MEPPLPAPLPRVVNKEGIFSGSKVLSNAAGTPLLRAKKSPLSRAKWTISCASSGAELCKTKTNPGLAKIAVEAAFPGRRETLVAVPNFNDLSQCVFFAFSWSFSFWCGVPALERTCVWRWRGRGDVFEVQAAQT